MNVTGAGLKVGLSQSAGTTTCSSGRPGSSGSVQLDAADWTSWGVTYVKYSNCNNKIAALDTFQSMQIALAGKPVFYAVQNWNHD